MIPHVVVTGMGAVSAFGEGCEALRAAIAEGREGIRPILRFPTAGFGTELAALVPGADGPPPDPRFEDGTALDGLWARFTLAAAREAMAQARIEERGIPRHRIALVLGSLRGHRGGAHELAAVTGEALGIDGPRIDVAAACSSSTHAIALGHDLVVLGAADVVIAGGADVITPDMFAGFDALGLLARGPAAPFSDPPGTTLGEGAGLLVLERAERAREGGVTPIGSIAGCGLSADGHHATSPDPTGAGLARALTGALRDAGLAPEAIGYVNAHGTGTLANDDAEWRALQRVLGERAAATPVSASKSIFGHAQGAAGALEAIVTLQALAAQAVPPTRHFTHPRPRGPIDPVAGTRPRPHHFDAALSQNAAFGGANGALVIGAPTLAGRPRARRPVVALGAGALGPHGTTIDELLAVLDVGAPIDRRTVPPFALERIAPMADPRGLDPAACFITAACARALADARLAVRGSLRERAGLFVGCYVLSPTSGREFNDSIARRGLHRLSANAFTRIVLNAAAGSASLLLALRGPLTNVGAAEASGLLALVHAADYLSRHDEADAIVAGGAEERAPEAAPDRAEGAAFLALAAGPLAEARGAVRVAGWGLAGPGRLDDAIDAALAMSGPASLDLVAGRAPRVAHRIDARSITLDARRVDPAALLGDAGGASSALAAAAALALLRRGAARTALVVDDTARAASCALLLTLDGSPERTTA